MTAKELKDLPIGLIDVRITTVLEIIQRNTKKVDGQWAIGSLDNLHQDILSALLSIAREKLEEAAKIAFAHDCSAERRYHACSTVIAQAIREKVKEME